MAMTQILGLLGGLALFLYGMEMMSGGLEAAAGNRMRGILERLTENRFMGIFVGAALTAVIQSSSATTVMAVGFVNSGMLRLEQAVWVIMGANVGTTVTGQLIALDVGLYAPLIAFIGVSLIVFTKAKTARHWGQVIAGLGILFVGMKMMSEAMAPLGESPFFIDLLTNFENPLFGIAAGMIFTAVIQSSSASVGILQALAMSGLIDLPSAVFVLFGQNIGTCVTAALASVGADRNAKRTTVVHFLFNVIGTALFTILCLTTPLVPLVESFTPHNATAQIANMHTLFNVVTTLVLLPFGTGMTKLARKILPETDAEKEGGFHLAYLKEFDFTGELSVGATAIAASGISRELGRMCRMTRENVDAAFDAVLNADTSLLPAIEEREDYIDYLNKEIQQYISQSLAAESSLNDELMAKTAGYFRVAGNLERIGDHAMNIAAYGRRLNADKIDFSTYAKAEIVEMKEMALTSLDVLVTADLAPVDILYRVSDAEKDFDTVAESFRSHQMDRMGQGICSGEACVLYSELLSDFERVGDHLLNIGEALYHSDITLN